MKEKNELYPLLKKLRLAGHTWESCREQVRGLGIETTADALRKRYARLKAEQNLNARQSPHAPTEKLNLDDVDDLRQLFVNIEQQRGIHHDNINRVYETDIHIAPHTRYVGLNFFSDLHIGCAGTNYNLMLDDFSKVGVRDDVLSFGVGDYCDNYIASAPKGGSFETLIRPSDQRALARRMLKMINPLAISNGCHSEWSVSSDDYDFDAELAKELGCTYLGHGGIINLSFGGDAIYTIMIRHKYTNNSNKNPYNSLLAMHSDYGFDIGVQAHFHEPLISALPRTKRHKMSYIARCGSYKVEDHYGSKLAGYAGQPQFPFFVIDTQDKKVVHYGLDLDEGLRILSAFNKEVS